MTGSFEVPALVEGDAVGLRVDGFHNMGGWIPARYVAYDERGYHVFAAGFKPDAPLPMRPAGEPATVTLLHIAFPADRCVYGDQWRRAHEVEFEQPCDRCHGRGVVGVWTDGGVLIDAEGCKHCNGRRWIPWQPFAEQTGI